MGWGLWQLLPAGLQIRMITIEADRVTISVESTAAKPNCPLCNRPATRIHRYCERTLLDVPCFGRAVRLQVRARHFYCSNPTCPRKTFSERLNGIAGVYARRTQRLTEIILEIAYESGGECGAREVRKLGIPISGPTMLRVLKLAPLLEMLTPTVLGVDDWSWKKGQRYGTLLVDLEHHCPVDILPDRTSDSFAQWLRDHPGVHTIARDRAQVYADGANKGAPEAIQIADRFHLVANLNDAVEDFLTRNHKQLRATTKALGKKAAQHQQKQAGESTTYEERPFPNVEQTQQLRRSRRKARYEEVLELHKQGLSQRAIARVMRMSRDTVGRYLKADGFPEYAAGCRKYKPSMLDPFEQYLRQRWNEGCQNASTLHKELLQKGFTGAESTVRYFVRKWRPEGNRVGKPAEGAKRLPASPKVPSYTPRKAAWLLVKPQDELKPKEEGYLAELCRICPLAATVRELSVEFGRIVRERDQLGLHRWLEAAQNSGVQEITSFADGIGRDLVSVEAALSSEWSSGQIEGQINRLKLLKRQCYGRSGFELLRRRVLPMAAGS